MVQKAVKACKGPEVRPDAQGNPEKWDQLDWLAGMVSTEKRECKGKLDHLGHKDSLDHEAHQESQVTLVHQVLKECR